MPKPSSGATEKFEAKSLNQLNAGLRTSVLSTLTAKAEFNGLDLRSVEVDVGTIDWVTDSDLGSPNPISDCKKQWEKRSSGPLEIKVIQSVFKGTVTYNFAHSANAVADANISALAGLLSLSGEVVSNSDGTERRRGENLVYGVKLSDAPPIEPCDNFDGTYTSSLNDGITVKLVQTGCHVEYSTPGSAVQHNASFEVGPRGRVNHFDVTRSEPGNDCNWATTLIRLDERSLSLVHTSGTSGPCKAIATPRAAVLTRK